jgi:hypothetical protein
MKKTISLLMLGVCVLFSFCKKEIGGDDDNNGGTNPPPVDTIPVVVTPPDPALANSLGFFMDDWQPKTFAAPDAKDTATPASASITVTVDASTILSKISPILFGNNANSWMGDFSNNTLLKYITGLKPKVIRFPGGSISDVYFWNQPGGSKPADAPSTLVNSDGTSTATGWSWSGMNNDSWTCSLDKYYSMLQQTSNEGMITINYGYARYGTSADPVAAAAHLAADWVRYDNGRTKYWEIGNENFGSWEAGYRINLAENKDGQPEIVTGETYGSILKYLQIRCAKLQVKLTQPFVLVLYCTTSPRHPGKAVPPKTGMQACLQREGERLIILLCMIILHLIKQMHHL